MIDNDRISGLDGDAAADALVEVRKAIMAAGGDGTPQVEEFAADELAALLGVSTTTGTQLVADAVNLRHRHPTAWARVVAGVVPVWLVTRFARRCAATGLTRNQARWVDTGTTPYVATLRRCPGAARRTRAAGGRDAASARTAGGNPRWSKPWPRHSASRPRKRHPQRA